MQLSIGDLYRQVLLQRPTVKSKLFKMDDFIQSHFPRGCSDEDLERWGRCKTEKECRAYSKAMWSKYAHDEDAPYTQQEQIDRAAQAQKLHQERAAKKAAKLGTVNDSLYLSPRERERLKLKGYLESLAQMLDARHQTVWDACVNEERIMRQQAKINLLVKKLTS